METQSYVMVIGMLLHMLAAVSKNKLITLDALSSKKESRTETCHVTQEFSTYSHRNIKATGKDKHYEVETRKPFC